MSPNGRATVKEVYDLVDTRTAALRTELKGDIKSLRYEILNKLNESRATYRWFIGTAIGIMTAVVLLWSVLK
jgi:hypothetical protein